MAEGGEAFEMADVRIFPLKPQTADRTSEVSFVNPVFDEGTQYNTIDNSNLIDPETPGHPPQLELATESLSTGNKQDIILKALSGSTWEEGGLWKKGEERGAELLAAKAKLENGQLYVDINGKKVYLLKKDRKFYSYSSFKKTWYYYS